MSEYYVTQERAMAPGISGDWPEVIPKPGNPNGRLVKVEGAEDLIRRVTKFVENHSDTSPAARILHSEMMEVFQPDMSIYDARVPEKREVEKP